MKRHPWFWATFSFWLLLGGAGIGRALLWGPPVLARKGGGDFDTCVNGADIHAATWSAVGTPEEAADLLETEWAREGWSAMGDGEDFLPLLLGSIVLDRETAEVVRRCAQVRVYKREGTVRVLGVLRKDAGRSLVGIHLDIPDSAIAFGNPALKDLDPPLAPPSHVALSTFRLGHSQGCLWRFSSSAVDPAPVFDWCRRNSFYLKPWQRDSPDEWFTVSRSGRHWLLGRLGGSEKGTWVWLSLPDRSHS